MYEGAAHNTSIINFDTKSTIPNLENVNSFIPGVSADESLNNHMKGVSHQQSLNQNDMGNLTLTNSTLYGNPSFRSQDLNIKPVHLRTLKIWVCSVQQNILAINQYFSSLLDRSVTMAYLVDYSSGIIYLTFSTQEAARLCHSNASHLPQILKVEITTPDDIDFEINLVVIHGEDVNRPNVTAVIERIIHGTGFSVIGLIDLPEEPRSKIVCFNTNTIQETFGLLEKIATKFFCSPVKRTKQICVYHSTMKEVDIIKFIKQLAGSTISEVIPYSSGANITFICVENAQNFRSEQHHILQQMGFIVFDYFPCLTKEFYIRISHLLPKQLLNTMDPNNFSPLNPQNYVFDGSSFEMNNRAENSFQPQYKHPQDHNVPSNYPPNYSSYKSYSSKMMEKNTTLNICLENSQPAKLDVTINTFRSSYTFSKSEMLLFSKSKLLEQYQEKYSTLLQLELNKDECKLCVSGEQNIVELVLNSFVKDVSEAYKPFNLDIPVFEDIIEILKIEGIDERINNRFNEKKLNAHFTLENGLPAILYDATLEKDEIIKALKSNITISVSPLSQECVQKFSESSWRQHFDTLKTKNIDFKFATIKVNRKESQLKIIAPHNGQEELKEMFIDFLQKQKIIKKEIEFQNTKLEFANMYLKSELQSIENLASGNGIKMTYRDDRFHIIGLEQEVKELEKQIIKLREMIHHRICKLELWGIEEYLSDKGAHILSSIGKNNSCILKLDVKKQIKTRSDDQKKIQDTCIHSSKTYSSNIKMMCCDVSEINSDAYINFITENWLKGNMPKGFAGDEENWKVIKIKGGSDLELLNTKSTTFRDKKIVNTICSVKSIAWKTQIDNCFKKVLKKTKLRSVAFAVDMFEEAYVKEFLDCVRENIIHRHKFNQPVLDVIYICSISEDKLRIAKNCFPPTEKDTRKKESKAESRLQSSSKVSESEKIQGNTTRTFQAIKVVLKYGDIVLERSDVVVTSISPDLDMTKAMVTERAAKQGGEKIQEELKTNYPDGIKYGEIAVSTGGRLDAKYLFHASLPNWSDNHSSNIVKRLMESILAEANKRSCVSISIPALGTGKLSYDSKKTCSFIMESIKNYAKHNPATSIKTVNLIVFHSNNDVYRAYSDVFTNDQKENKEELQSDYAPTNTIKPTIQPNSSSFGKVKIKIITGDITEQSTDTVVITVDKSLNLGLGAIANIVLSKGGQELQKDLHNKYPLGIKLFEWASIQCSKMKCQNMYLLSLPDWSMQIKLKVVDVLVELLQQIDSSMASSISLPAIGTGNLRYPPEESKDIIFEALRKFSERPPAYLQCVEIVVFAKDTPVKNVFLENVSSSNFFSGILGGISRFMTSFLTNTETNIVSDIEKYNHGKLTFNLKRGDIMEESCDAIVVAVSDTMDFNKSGELCKRVASTCTDDFITHCKEKGRKLPKKGSIMVKTKGESLKCGIIFFLSSNKYADEWDKGIKAILDKADKMKLHSIAFPLFAEESGRMEFHCSQMMTAFLEFSSTSSINSLDININVKEEATFKCLQKYFNDMESGGSLSECAKIVVTFKNEQDRSCAIQTLTGKCQSDCSVRTYTSQVIKIFTNLQVFRLHKIGRENLLNVTVSKNEIHVKGFGDCSKIEDEMKKIEMEDINGVLNNIKTDVRWLYDDNGTWQDFSNPINLKLQSAFNTNETHCNIDIDDESYNIDFTNLIAKNKSTGKTMKIKQQTIKGELMPVYWDEMDDNDLVTTIPLLSSSEEYKKVETHYKHNGALGTVLKIERVQNISLYQQYASKKREIEKRNSGEENELLLYHGSDINAIKEINKTGFNRSYCGKNAVVYGDGVYFARDSSYSEKFANPDQDGNRRLYQVRVLVGKSTITIKGMKYLPKRPDCDALYDSGKAPDDRSEGIFVIFHDSQAYPEYLLTVALPAKI